MDKARIISLLSNYHELIRKVDQHIAAITHAFKSRIACTKGCDGCCRALTLFPVEAMALSLAFMDIPEKTRNQISQRIEREKNQCPLLIRRECVLYAHRPVICRTHGYPIYMKKNGQARVDFCPENFKGMTTFKKEMMLDIDHLNLMLAAISKQFTDSLETRTPFPDRIPVARALFLFCTQS